MRSAEGTLGWVGGVFLAGLAIATTSHGTVASFFFTRHKKEPRHTRRTISASYEKGKKEHAAAATAARLLVALACARAHTHTRRPRGQN